MSAEIPKGYCLKRVVDKDRDDTFATRLKRFTAQVDATHVQDVIDKVARIDATLAWRLEVSKEVATDAPFRLLLQRKDRHREWTRYDPYVAVSYCWHNQDWSVAPGLIKRGLRSKPKPLTEPVFEQLGQRLKRGEGLWIDQLCIDQNNVREQHAAVASAHLVYRNARKVVIVWEDVKLNKNEIRGWNNFTTKMVDKFPLDDFGVPIGFAHSMAHRAHTMRNAFDHPWCISMLEKLAGARWLRRAWCINEYWVSKDSEWFVPTAEGVLVMRADDFGTFLYGMLDSVRYRTSSSDFRYLSHIWDLMKRKERHATYTTSTRTPLDLPVMLSLSSTFPEDRLNILLSSHNTGLTFRGKIADNNHLALAFGTIALACGFLSVLFYSGQHIPLLTGTGCSVLQLPHPSDTSFEVQAEQMPLNSISLSGLRLNLLIFYGTRRHAPTLTALRRVSKLAACPKIHQQLRNVSESIKLSRNPWVLDWENALMPIAKSLAFAVDCGPFTMAQAADQVLRAQPSLNMYCSSWLIRGIRRRVFRVLFLEDLNHLVDDPNLTMAEKHQITKQVTKYVLLLVAGVNLHAGGACVASKNGFSFLHERLPDQSILAMPVVLRGAQKLFVPRLWGLSRVYTKQGPAWRVTGKVKAWGIPDLDLKHDPVTLLADQRIVGSSEAWKRWQRVRDMVADRMFKMSNTNLAQAWRDAQIDTTLRLPPIGSQTKSGFFGIRGTPETVFNAFMKAPRMECLTMPKIQQSPATQGLLAGPMSDEESNSGAAFKLNAFLRSDFAGE